jgi:hypothetical protein
VRNLIWHGKRLLDPTARCSRVCKSETVENQKFAAYNRPSKIVGRTPEELYTIIEEKQKEIADAIAQLRAIG